MKCVTIYARGGKPVGANPYYEAVLGSGRHQKYLQGEFDGTADQNLLTAMAVGLEALKEPCRVTLVTATGLRFKNGRPLGRNIEQKQRILDVARARGHELVWDFRKDAGEDIKAIMRRHKTAAPLKSTIAKQKHGDADWPATHYKWTGPTGIADWIPHDIDMGSRVNEMAPF